MALPVLTLARGAGLAFSLDSVTAGVLGHPELLQSLVRTASKLATRSRGIDSGAAQDMVDMMRSRVPQDTGRLYNGITWRIEADAYLVEASAVRISSTGRQSADYARFVEFGTKAGTRGVAQTAVADVGFFSADTFTTTRRGTPTRRTRRARRTHPGTAAKPFFFNSAREILAARGQRLEHLVDELALEEGWR